MTSVSFFFIMLIFGLISIGIGISIYRGYRRYEYIYPYYYSGAANYASIPFGIMFLMWGILSILKVPDNVGLLFTTVSILIGLTGLVFNFIQPQFMRPQWYRWLKENHGDIMPWLRQDVESMGYSEWKERTKTITELEDWAIDVRKRYRWEIEAVKKNGGFPQ